MNNPILPVETIVFRAGRVFMLDQTLLPLEKVVLEIASAEQMWQGIRELKVRGAPAIGVAAAYGLWLGIKDLPDSLTRAEMLEKLERVHDYLNSARPTAVNLSWALRRGLELARQTEGGAAELKAAVLEEAHRIRRSEEATTRAIGEHGVALFAGIEGVLTHCNAGSAATVGLGTALAPIYVAFERGQRIHVYADETRPLLQGARITAWELMQAGLPVTLITDSMAAVVMREGRVGAVIVGADRVAANGDFANKIGTYGVALLARAHGLPFYVAAPFSTVDFATPDGSGIEIEQRDPLEVTHFGGRPTAPPGVGVYNPAFDMTPAPLVTAFITELGVVKAPFLEGLAALKSSSEPRTVLTT